MSERRKARFSVFDGLAALVEDDRAKQGEEDLLAEERELARKAPWWRPWWLGFAVNGDWFRGRRGTWAAVVVFGAIGVWLLWMVAVGGPPGTEGRVFGDAVPDEEYAVSGEAGRVLRAEEVGLALAYGEPVELGLYGRPVVVHGVTGEERELTSLEVSFVEEHGPEGLSGVNLGENYGVWNPGPRGLGMWWREDPVARYARAELAFTREGWREKQELELRWLAERLEDAVEVVSRLETPAERQRGVGLELAAVLDRIGDRYPSVRERRGVAPWAALPRRWVCDEGLEFGITGGITQGCPVPELQVAVSELWGSAGAVYGELAELARMLNYLDGLTTEQYYEGGEILSVYYRMVDILEVEMASMAAAAAGLRYLSSEREFYFAVDFFDSGPG